MKLHVDDDGFVRAPRGLVYRRLTDLASWPAFWPATKVDLLSPAAGDVAERFEVQVGAAGLRPRFRLELAADRWRHDEGFRLTVDGAVTGEAEFWLEEGWGGTVVHHLADLTVQAKRPRAVGKAYRAWLRGGFCGLKDGLQAEVRERLGMVR